MPRVVPSQIVDFIDGITPIEISPGVTRVNSVGSARLRGVLDLVGQLPDELLVMDGTTYASFVAAKANIEDLLEAARGPMEHLQKPASHNPRCLSKVPR